MMSKAYYESHKEAIADRQMRNRYGFGLADKQAMLDAQGGVCGICKQPPKRPVIDHDHTTGSIRGILCSGCNVLLGKLGDDLASVNQNAAKLISYLENCGFVNVYTIMDARMVDDAELIYLKDGKPMTKCRVADNPPGKKDDKRPARFVTCKAFGAQAEAMAKLSKNDVITVSGNLQVEAFESKDGQKRTADVLMVNSFRVQKSESFYGDSEKPVRKGKEESSLDDLFGAP